MYLKTSRSLRFIELFNGMFKSRYALQIWDWDTKDRKQDVNNHANQQGALNVSIT